MLMVLHKVFLNGGLLSRSRSNGQSCLKANANSQVATGATNLPYK